MIPDGHPSINKTEPIIPTQIDPEPEPTSKLWKVVGWLCILLIIALVTYIALKHFRCCVCVFAKRTESEEEEDEDVKCDTAEPLNESNCSQGKVMAQSEDDLIL